MTHIIWNRECKINVFLLANMNLEKFSYAMKTHFITLAGTPTAVQYPGIGLVTTAPAPKIAYSPIDVWLIIFTPVPQ